MSEALWLRKNTQVGPYTIVECIGEGGMGQVYKAYEASLNRYVAIKFISTELKHDTVIVTRLKNEGLALAKINHKPLSKN